MGCRRPLHHRSNYLHGTQGLRALSTDRRDSIYLDCLWSKYFRDPSQWWDNRRRKTSPTSPDFQHKTTKVPLWIDSWCNPSWIHDELGAKGLATSRDVEDRKGCAGKGNGKHQTSQTDFKETADIVASLKACAQQKDLHEGTRVHADILKAGLLEKNCYVANSLVSMYAKCGALEKARRLVEELPIRDVVSWSALISGYAQHAQGEEALKCFERMQNEGLAPNAVTFTCILKACASIGAADKGQQIHDEIVRQGLLGKNSLLGNALVDMYAKCGALEKAQRVLDELLVRDVVSWSALIAGYTQNGQAEEALKCFKRMQNEGLSPNEVTFICILKACGSIGAADKGQQIHDEIVQQGLLRKNIMLGTALLDMHAKCGALKKAQQVFDELPVRDAISWSALIAGYAQQGQGEEALKCFERMQNEGLSPTAVTFLCILKACGSLGAADKGQQIHDEIVRQGLLAKKIVLGNALVDMYAKCGALEKAHRVLDELPVRDVVSFNALIAGYAQQGQGEEALKCFERMKREGLSPDAVTFTCILKGCARIGATDKGQLIHEEIVKQALLGKDIVLGNALVDMYAKCGAFEKAQRVLNEFPVRDVVSLNTLIAGYAQQGQAEEALKCFEQMQREGLSPDAVTFTCILKACGSAGAADKGQEIHDEIVRQGLLGKNIVLGTALVDMYAKCGELLKAQRVLDALPLRDVVCWSALITGYAQQGQGEEVLICYKNMQHEGLSPDAVTLGCVLKAFSHSGLLDEGLRCFGNMRTNYGILPDVQHYTHMVDLFGRAGNFDKALAVIKKMPSSDCVPAWSALLGACQKWGNVKVGRLAFEHAVEVDKTDAAAYVCMANIFAATGIEEETDKVESAWKNPGCGWWINASGNV